MTKKKTVSSRNAAVLTVGFHGANPPLIWRLDLDRNHSFSLSLQGDEGDWDLGMSSARGEFTSIAHFVAREDAEDAFGVVETSLRSNTPTWLRRTAKTFWYVLAIIFTGVLLLAGQALYLVSVDAKATRQGSLPAEIGPGVPLSADDVLQPPPAP